MAAVVNQASAIEAVARYFYFITLDSNLSFVASRKVAAELRARHWLGHEHRSRWIQMASARRQKLHQMRPRPWHRERSELAGVIQPTQFDLRVWSNFLTSARPEEVEVVLWSRILKFTDHEIAAALNLTVGTVRYRVGHGLRHLGGQLEP